MAYPEIRPTILAPLPRAATDSADKIMAPLPHAALARLPQLHAESRLALHRSRLLARAVPAAGLLLLMAIPVALSGASLASGFVWSLLLLLGIGAVLRHHLRALAHKAGSASELRMIFLYIGVVWGTGAFLALGPGAAALPWVLAFFAGLPSLMLILLLGDAAAILAFAAPVTAIAAAMLLLRAGPAALAPLFLTQTGLGLLLLKNRPRWGNVPAGLSLR